MAVDKNKREARNVSITNVQSFDCRTTGPDDELMNNSLILFESNKEGKIVDYSSVTPTQPSTSAQNTYQMNR